MLNTQKKKLKCLPTERCRLASCITRANLSARPAAQSERDGESELLDHEAQHNCLQHIGYKSSIKTLRSHQKPIC